MRIGIIGGSIAGCSAAILLRELGFNVMIFERSSRELTGRGAGIVLPEDFIQQCINSKLFNKDIPRIPITTRTFIVKDEKFSDQGRSFWKQPLHVMALHWGDVYSNLRSRIPNGCYFNDEEVTSVCEGNDTGYVETSKGKQYQFDLLIAADGIDSIVRKKLFPNNPPVYAGYVAWRGTTYISESIYAQFSGGQMPCYVFKNGHLLFYQIPQSLDQKNGDKLFNWLIYETYNSDLLDTLLVDKNGKKHDVSLPAGSLSTQHLQHLVDLADRVLPTQMADIIRNTKMPFLQVIFDWEIPQHVKNRICFIGIALRPHSGAGVTEAINHSNNLTNILKKIGTQNLLMGLKEWDSMQTKLTREQVELAKTLGTALVTDSPDWGKMDAQSMEIWWKKVIGERKWHATTPKTTNPCSKWHTRNNLEPNRPNSISTSPTSSIKSRL